MARAFGVAPEIESAAFGDHSSLKGSGEDEPNATTPRALNATCPFISRPLIHLHLSVIVVVAIIGHALLKLHLAGGE